MSHAYLRAAPSSTNQFCSKVPMNEREARRVAAGKRTYLRGLLAAGATFMSVKGLYAYACDRCSMWHVGHEPGTTSRTL